MTSFPKCVLEITADKEFLMSQAITKNPLGTEPIGKLVTQYAIPSVVAMVVSSLYNMVDQVFIGRGVGYIGNAATNVTMPMTFIVMAMSLLIGNGSAAFMNLELGKQNERKAAKGVGNMVILTVGMGLMLLVLFSVFLRPLCRLFGGQGEVLEYAMAYGRIIALGTPFAAASSSFASIIRADGRPKQSMLGMIIGCGVNMILDPVFIFVFGWGVEGAAIATVIGQFLNASFFIWCMFHFKSVRLEKDCFVPEWKTSSRICALGLSSFLTQIATVFVTAIQNNLLVKYGALSIYGPDIPLAAFSITMKSSQLIMSIALGIATGVQPVLSYNYGAAKYKRVKKAFWTSLAACEVIMLIAFLVFQIFPEYVVLLFGQESELYMQFAVKCFRIYLMMVMAIPCSMAPGIFFQATGHPVPAAVLSLFRQVLILIPASLILGSLFGIDGLLAAGPVGDFTAAAISLVTLAVKWKGIFKEIS